MSRTAIKCHCGQRIHQKDVMQTGYHMRMFGPNFVYVKFRCSRCKKLGEQFVKQDEWEAGVLKNTASELTTAERERFAALGPIDMDEMVDFHYALEQGVDLAALDAEFQKPRTAETPAPSPETGAGGGDEKK
jgi:DNA-directed RNA polymerase subunit RPC12/RpoP